MKYDIVGARYEGGAIFGSVVLATSDNEEHAKMIVDALKKSDDAALFHFGYIEKNS